MPPAELLQQTAIGHGGPRTLGGAHRRTVGACPHGDGQEESHVGGSAEVSVGEAVALEPL